MHQQYVYQILIFFIRIGRFLGASRQFHLCKDGQKPNHLDILVIRAGDRFLVFFLVKATTDCSTVLHCTCPVPPADNRQIHFFGRVGKKPENPCLSTSFII